jgi:hypothetical protein
LWNDPVSVTRWTKAQNQTNTEDREKIMPEYQRARQLLPVGEGTRMVNGKPQRVQNNIDLDYILPFSSDVSIGGPAMEAWRFATTGQNGLGQQIIQPGMSGQEKIKEYARYAWSNLGPSVPLPGNYAGEKLRQGLTGEVDRMGRQYDLPSAAAQVFAGIKNVPINTDEQYRQKISEIRRQQRDINDVITRIRRDQRLTEEEKKQQIKDHANRIRKLSVEAREAQEAYRRLKERGAI